MLAGNKRGQTISSFSLDKLIGEDKPNTFVNYKGQIKADSLEFLKFRNKKGNIQPTNDQIQTVETNYDDESPQKNCESVVYLGKESPSLVDFALTPQSIHFSDEPQPKSPKTVIAKQQEIGTIQLNLSTSGDEEPPSDQRQSTQIQSQSTQVEGTVQTLQTQTPHKEYEPAKNSLYLFCQKCKCLTNAEIVEIQRKKYKSSVLSAIFEVVCCLTNSGSNSRRKNDTFIFRCSVCKFHP